MKKRIIHCFLVLFLLNIGCQNPGEKKPPPPNKVLVVYRTGGEDSTESERGIDAVPDPDHVVNGVQIMWYMPQDKMGIEYFKIYRTRDEEGLRNYAPVGQLRLGQPGQIDTVFIDTQDLEQNVRYYYYVTAVDKDNQEGENSDTLSYTLLEKATNLSLNGNATEINQPEMRFEWWMTSGWTPDKYLLRIEALISEDFHPLVFVKRIQATYQTPQRFVMQGDYLKQLFPNGKYRWRIDCLGLEDLENQDFSGSESDWSIFTVKWSQ